MYSMTWNDETLAVRAKKWLETCNPTKEPKSDREHQIYNFIGQNLFHKLGMETVKNSTMSHEIVIKKIMNDWFFRVDFELNMDNNQPNMIMNSKSSKNIGSFLNTISANTTQVKM